MFTARGAVSNESAGKSDGEAGKSDRVRISSLTAVPRHVYRRAAVSLPSRRGKFTVVPR